MTALVSVIVPTKNRPDVLCQALESVAAQAYREIEVVVVNDGGQVVDETVGAFRNRLDIHLVRLPTSQGASAARNAGIDIARGRYLAFLDDDDLYLSHHLESAVRVLESDAADVVYATSAVSGVRLTPREADGWAGTVAFDLPFSEGLLAVTNYIPTSAVVCRALPDAGARFDPGLRVQEDWDMWLRLLYDKGFRFAHLPAPGLIYHRISGADSATSAILDDVEVHREFHRTYQLMIDRWPVPPESRAAEYRVWMLHVYDLVFDLMARGDRLDAHWYERVLAVLFAGFTGELAENELAGRLDAAVRDL